jgi:hypothetical protein
MLDLFVAVLMLIAVTASADDLGALKEAARRYVASMKAVLALPGTSDCPETGPMLKQIKAAIVAARNRRDCYRNRY